MINRPFSFVAPKFHQIMACAVIGFVASCGPSSSPQGSGTSANYTPSTVSETAVRFAAGPVSAACLRENRRAATPSRCGCVQAAANLTLTPTEQRKAARFFDDPDTLQEVRVSDTPANERFWDTWKRFSDTAEQLCSRR